MSDESRADCQCKCPECVNARKVIRNLKKRLKGVREFNAASTPVTNEDEHHKRAIERLCDLREPWPTNRTNYGASR